MTSSLDELLSKDGFRGKGLLARTRSFFRAENVSGNKVRTARTKSDVARHSTIGETSTFTRHRRGQDHQFKTKKLGSGLRNESMESFAIEEKEVKGQSVNPSQDGSENEVIEVEELEDVVVKDVYLKKVRSLQQGKDNYSDEARTGRETYKHKSVKNTVNERPVIGNGSMRAHSSFNWKMSKIEKQTESSYDRGNRGSRRGKSGEEIAGRNHYLAVNEVSEPPLDEIAVQAIVSILNGYIKRFLKDEDFRITLRDNCFSSLNFFEIQEGQSNETKVIMSLEQAMETVEHAAEEGVNAKDLRKSSLQLSVITGLSLNDLKDEFTCGIPNYKLSACAHLYLSVVYLIQKKERASAKHLLQVFCDSPFQARTCLLPELWERVFSSNLAHLTAWYNQKAGSLPGTPSMARKRKLLAKLYNEALDSGTYQFAVYYKDWITEGIEIPSVPSIDVPSESVVEGQQEGLPGHYSATANSKGSFSPQPMVSKKLYDAVFSSSRKSGIGDDEGNSITCLSRSPDGSSIVRKALLYESRTTIYRNQAIEECIHSSAIIASSHDAEESARTRCEKRLDMFCVSYQEVSTDDIDDHIAQKETPATLVNQCTLPQIIGNEMSLEKFVEFDKEMLNIEKHSYPMILSSGHQLQPSQLDSSISELNEHNEHIDEASFFLSIPKDFICPLTGKLFTKHVTLENGQSFEQAAIIAWLEEGNITCPVTGKFLEYLLVPSVNVVLKHLIHDWKSKHFKRLLEIGSQIIDLEFQGHENWEEAAVYSLGYLLSTSDNEDQTRYVKHFILQEGLEFLLRRFELGTAKEKFYVVMLLMSCVEVQSTCRYQIAQGIDKQCIPELLYSKQLKSRATAISLMKELICLQR